MSRSVSRRGFLFGAAAVASMAACRPAFRTVSDLVAELPFPIERRPVAEGWSVSPGAVLDIDARARWTNRAVYDASVTRQDDSSLWMWYSTRGDKPGSIALAIDMSGTGDRWQAHGTEPVLQPESEALELSRPSVIQVNGGWRMWYSARGKDSVWIETASSRDGTSWTKHGQPVLPPALAWEKDGCQCPNVIYDMEAGLYKMWYSGGDVYEPDAVGYATSPDGLAWTRLSEAPMYTASQGWEDFKVGSFQVKRVDDWYYAFYNAFQSQPFVSRIGMARSRDGVSGWERHPDNPVISPDKPGSWTAAMVYKPTALWNAQQQHWDVWFNASEKLNSVERIGHAWNDRLW